MTTTDCVINIINAVKRHECLWNAKHHEYAKRDKLEKAWAQVTKEVGRSDKYCREKWRNVRTGFLRSIQNNIRIVPDESSNDLMAIRKKQFYLYDYMIFILPSAETLGEARKRRKLARARNKVEDFRDDCGNETMQEYTLFGKYEQNGDMDDVLDNDIEQELEKEITQEAVSNKNPQQSETTALSNVDLLVKPHRDENFREHYNRGYDSQDVDQLVDFFRGNIDDILSLSKKNQRMFKRKMLELIEELHDVEDPLE